MTVIRWPIVAGSGYAPYQVCCIITVGWMWGVMVIPGLADRALPFVSYTTVSENADACHKGEHLA